MTPDAAETAAHDAGLLVMGALRRGAENRPGTTVILGTGPKFWPVFAASAEYADGAPDPIDRWSKRVIGVIAAEARATCSFPSDGPPYPPFIRWALDTGRFFSSPVGMMVHDTVGLMISIRGALHLDTLWPEDPEPAGSPCETCHAPCMTACPVGALGGGAYDVEACHNHLDRPEGQTCMMQGCAARRACPVSSGAHRRPEQSALHMRAFHPT